MMRYVRIGASKGRKKFSHAHKIGPWYLLGFFFPISVDNPRLFFYKGFPPPEVIYGNDIFVMFRFNIPCT